MRQLAACVFAAFLTGRDIREATWLPNPSYEVREEEAVVLRAAAQEVGETP